MVLSSLTISTPMISEHQTTNEQPTNKQWTANEQPRNKEQTKNEKNNEQPTTSQRPAKESQWTANDQPGTRKQKKKKQWTRNNKQWTMNNEQWTINNEQQTTNNNQQPDRQQSTMANQFQCRREVLSCGKICCVIYTPISVYCMIASMDPLHQRLCRCTTFHFQIWTDKTVVLKISTVKYKSPNAALA